MPPRASTPFYVPEASSPLSDQRDPAPSDSSPESDASIKAILNQCVRDTQQREMEEIMAMSNKQLEEVAQLRRDSEIRHKMMEKRRVEHEDQGKFLYAKTGERPNK